MSWSLSYSISSAFCGLITWGALDVPLSFQLLVKDNFVQGGSDSCKTKEK